MAAGTAFLAISDQYVTFFLFLNFDKMTVVGHFGCPKLTIALLAILDQYRIFYFLEIFTKWPPADILDVRKSLLIAFLAISDRSAILDV